MGTRYYLSNIRTLLTEGFSAEELRRLCFDVPSLRPVHNQLNEKTGKAGIIDHILEYTEQKMLLETLLRHVQELNPVRYEQHRPYSSPAPYTPAVKDRVPADSFLPPPVLSTVESPLDDYSIYEEGLELLLVRMGQAHPRIAEFFTYEEQLMDNIRHSRRFGDTAERRAERAAIIEQLNKLALSTLGVSFNSLCKQ